MLYFRLIVFPVVVYAQRNMAHMTNNAPEMARLQVCNLLIRARLGLLG